MMDYNTTIHSVTGFTPHFLLYGYVFADVHSPLLPEEFVTSRGEQLTNLSDQREKAKERMAKKQKEMASRYNLRRRVFHFKVGDLVMVKRLTRMEEGTTTKLNDRFKGPYKISKVVGNNSYLVKIGSKDHKYHADQLKIYDKRDDDQGRNESQTTDDEDVADREGNGGDDEP